MIVPRFRLRQDEECVTVTIEAPHCRLGQLEVHVDDERFAFWCEPYLLDLRLPGRLKGAAPRDSSFDSEEGAFTFHVEKLNRGEHFPDLGLIAALLAPTPTRTRTPTETSARIEVVGDASPSIVRDSESESGVDPSGRFPYGFANKLAARFGECGSEFGAVFELASPDETSFVDRRSLREERENEKFSSDHYLADYFDEELISPLLAYEMPWMRMGIGGENEFPFSSEELDLLKSLPDKEYLLSASERRGVLCGLVDVLFSYCYEKRTTGDEANVESGWTINRLSSTLSWFESFSDLRETLRSCYRRALVYPIYRNFRLCRRVKDDVADLFRIGRELVVRCLIEIYGLFERGQDSRYILNRLYIKDFLIFSRKCPEEEFAKIRDELWEIEITKNCLHLELEEYEEAGEMVQAEEAQVLENAMAIEMASLNLNEGRGDVPVDGKRFAAVSSSSESSDSDDSSFDSSDDESSTELDSDDCGSDEVS